MESINVICSHKERKITMSTNIEQAAKRNRKSMMELYCANKNSVYLFCKLLLGNDQKAAEATTSVFYENWHEVALHSTWTEISFHHSLMVIAAKFCWKKIFENVKQDFDAYKSTSNKYKKVQSKNFCGSIEDGMELLQRAFSQMKPIERYVYLSIEFGSLSTKELAHIINHSDPEIKAIYNSSISALSSYLPTDVGVRLSYPEVKSLLQKANKIQNIPQDAERTCVEQIKAISRVHLPPLHTLLFAVSMIVCSFVLIACLICLGIE